MGSRSNVWTSNAWKNQREQEIEEPIQSFAEIMSEELASQLTKEDIDPHPFPIPSVEYKDDVEFARALQREFDREYDLSTRMEQNRLAGSSSVSMTQDRYCPQSLQCEDSVRESDDDELDDLTEDQRYQMSKLLGPIGFSTARGPHGDWLTKHDPAIVSSRNVDKAMNDKIDVPTGDVLAFPVNSGAHVFNKLQMFSKTEQKRVHRLKDKEEKATMDISMDAQTRLSLFKLVNMGLFDRVDGVIATGKESAVLSAMGGIHSLSPYYAAIKVYKTSLVEFKNRSEYVQNDFRFKNPRRVMRIWAQKEFMNLTRMYNKQLPCPGPIKLRKHIMVMDFIGNEDGVAASKLKDYRFSDDVEKTNAFLQVKSILDRMYKDCDLVHGDLSEFNLLIEGGKVWVIDLAQAMDLSHPRAHCYLVRDIHNVLNFFGKIGTPGLPSAVEMFNGATDLHMKEGENLHVQVEEFETDCRNTKLKIDKSKPADFEMRMFMQEREHAPGEPDPSSLYN